MQHEVYRFGSPARVYLQAWATSAKRYSRSGFLTSLVQLTASRVGNRTRPNSFSRSHTRPSPRALLSSLSSVLLGAAALGVTTAAHAQDPLPGGQAPQAAASTGS